MNCPMSQTEVLAMIMAFYGGIATGVGVPTAFFVYFLYKSTMKKYSSEPAKEK